MANTKPASTTKKAAKAAPKKSAPATKSASKTTTAGAKAAKAVASSGSDPRIDAYIGKAAGFAQPILQHIRKLVHQAVPDAEETIKWGMPFFMNNGAILANMAAFKQHCSFGLWNAPLLKDPEKILQIKEKNAMGQFDRITTVKDMPSEKILVSYIREAADLNVQGVKKARPKAAPAKELPVPAPMAAALKKNKKAAATFENFPPSHRKEYIMWITEAKTEETREKRIATTIEWLLEGKDRMWKYRK